MFIDCFPNKFTPLRRTTGFTEIPNSYATNWYKTKIKLTYLFLISSCTTEYVFLIQIDMAFVSPMFRTSLIGLPVGAPQSTPTVCTHMVAADPKNSMSISTTPVPELQSVQTSPMFGRVITAMVTPFKRGNSEVDYSTAEKLAAHLVANGSDALVVAGTTGESPTLTWSEQYELFTAIRNAVGHRVKLIAGAGSNSTAEAVEATRRARKLGFDGTLQVVPYYNKPPQEGLYQHFRTIAETEPDLPSILYNIPGRCGINMNPDIIARLAMISNVIGIKQATTDLEQLIQVRKTTPSEFSIYAGDDGLTLPFLSLGATGVISVASHLIGPELQKMVKHFINGEVDAATEIHMRYNTLFNDLFCMTNPIPTKTALRLLGWPVGGCRLPLIDAPPDVERRLANLLTDLELM